MAGKCRKAVRIAVVGVGGMGNGHCSNTSKIEEVKLAAVCDSDPKTADTVAAQHQVKAFYDYRDLLSWGEIDGMVIATPHYFHSIIGIAAMKSGFHVLSEKPMAVTIGAADRFIRTAQQTGKVFAVMFQRRLEPDIRAAFEIVESGRLGALRRTLMISPEFRSQAYYDSGTWRATWDGEGGGVMLNQSPHILDIFVKLGGLPKRVTGRVETRTHRIEVEDHAEALLEYRNGATGYLFASTNEPGPGQVIEIVGDRGKLTLTNGRLRFVEYEMALPDWDRQNTQMWDFPKQQEVPIASNDTPCGHGEILRNWARAILYGEALVSPGADAAGGLELANAIMLSSYLKKPLDLPISRKAYEDFIGQMIKTSTFRKGGRHQRTTDPRLA